MGDDQRLVPQIFRADGLLLRQRRVPAHQYAPAVAGGHGQRVVFAHVHAAKEQAEVDQPLVEVFQHELGVAAGNAVAYVRVPRAQGPRRAGEEAHQLRLAAADAHLAGEGLVRAGDLLLRLAHKGEDLLGALAQHHALVGEHHLPRALDAADEQLLAQFRFQRLHLRGERRLRDVQGSRRRRDALLPRHGEKILQYAKLHSIASRLHYTRKRHKNQLWMRIQNKYLIYSSEGAILWP